MNPETETSATPARFTWIPEMGEISGFGGGYEDACRRMMQAGVTYREQTPVDVAALAVLVTLPRATEEGSEDEAVAAQRAVGKAAYARLQDAVAAAEDGCSGAMVGASSQHAWIVFSQGWAVYVAKMIESAARDKAEEPTREARRAQQKAEREERLRLRRERVLAWVQKMQGPDAAEGVVEARDVPWSTLFFDDDGSLHALAGCWVDSVAEELCLLASALQKPAQVDFNGWPLRAEPGQTAEAVVSLWQAGVRG